MLTAITPGTPITLPPGTPMVAAQSQAAQQTLYRIPTAQGGHQIISIPGMAFRRCLEVTQQHLGTGNGVI